MRATVMHGAGDVRIEDVADASLEDAIDALVRVDRVLALPGGQGVHSVLECVGTEQSMNDAVAIARPGGAIGRVGVPHYAGIAAPPTFYRNVIVGGGPAPVRAYVDELLPDVLEGRIHPGRVFDRVIGLDAVPDGYRAMDQRESIKVMINF